MWKRQTLYCRCVHYEEITLIKLKQCIKFFSTVSNVRIPTDHPWGRKTFNWNDETSDHGPMQNSCVEVKTRWGVTQNFKLRLESTNSHGKSFTYDFKFWQNVLAIMIPFASESETEDDTSGKNVSKSNFPVLVPDFKYQYPFSSSIISSSCTIQSTNQKWTQSENDLFTWFNIFNTLKYRTEYLCRLQIQWRCLQNDLPLEAILANTLSITLIYPRN